MVEEVATVVAEVAVAVEASLVAPATPMLPYSWATSLTTSLTIKLRKYSDQRVFLRLV